MAGICMALTPAIFALGPWTERTLFPVVRDTTISDETPGAGGVSFNVRFRKVRDCTFIGLVWYDGPQRMNVEFEPETTSPPAPRTRPSGQQVAGPWRMPGLDALKGTRAYVMHRCHPLWMTITAFYRG